tara:strand:- start:1221 stop:1745 length:525 start_codon:yes stop_codon:yes gene_type:complete
MTRNYKIIIIIIFGLSIFFVLLKGLNNSNKYSSEKIYNKIDLNIAMKSLFDEEDFTIKELINEDGIFLINIWSSWCVPCREEHLYLMQLKDENLEIIGINYKDKKNNAKNFIQDMGNPYKKILIDNDGTNSIEFGAIGVPETYLIKRSTSIMVKKYIGALDQQKFDEIIKIIEQ